MTMRKKEGGTCVGRSGGKLIETVDPVGWRIVGSGALEGVSGEVRGG